MWAIISGESRRYFQAFGRKTFYEIKQQGDDWLGQRTGFPLSPGATEMVLLPISWSRWADVLDRIVCLLHSGCFGRALPLALRVGNSPDCCHVCSKVLPDALSEHRERWAAGTVHKESLLASSLWALCWGYFMLIRGFNSWLCCGSVAQWFLTLCNPMDCSTPSFPILHHLREFAQTLATESVIRSSHLILCRPLLLLPSIFSSIRIFFNESALHIRWPKYWSFSFIFPMNIGARLPTEKSWALAPQEGLMQPTPLPWFGINSEARFIFQNSPWSQAEARIFGIASLLRSFPISNLLPLFPNGLCWEPILNESHQTLISGCVFNPGGWCPEKSEDWLPRWVWTTNRWFRYHFPPCLWQESAQLMTTAPKWSMPNQWLHSFL